jgi:hypothetical protein
MTEGGYSFKQDQNVDEDAFYEALFILNAIFYKI